MTDFFHRDIVRTAQLMPSQPSSRGFHRQPSRTRPESSRQVVARTIQSYEQYATVYVRHWARHRQPPLLRAWLNLLPRGGYVLDLGCGPGQDARVLQRKRYPVLGLDLSNVLLRHARRRSPRTPLVQADMRELPVRRCVFDGVWAAASLIHLPKSAVTSVLRGVKGLVRPGGILAATFVHGRSSGILTAGWIPGRYFSRWRKDELTAAVRRAGWQVIALDTVVNRERKGRWLNLLARRPLDTASSVSHHKGHSSERSGK